MAARTRHTFAAGVRRVFELSLGQMIWSRRTMFMAVIVAVPVVIAVALRAAQAAGYLSTRSDAGAGTFGLLVWLLYLAFVVPALGVFYGTSLIADEVEDRTITYLFTRPLRRGAVLAGKYLAYLVCTTLVVLPSVVAVYFVLVPWREVAESFRWLAADLGVLAIGLAVYGALFALVGAAVRRPLLAGLLFAFGWEPFALLLPGYISRFTVASYLHALVPHAMPPGSGGFLLAAFASPPSSEMGLLTLTALLAGTLLLAMWTVEHREYVLEQ